jgi:hypothetical protein
MAAGQGFKTFATGDVLTAADTNGYLMQGVWVFASAAARTSAVTSPQEGNMSFLKDTNSVEYYDGAAWVAVGGSSSGPAFIGYASVSQTLVANTFTKVQINNERIDTDSCFNTTNYRFTPTKAGLYDTSVNIVFGSTPNRFLTMIYKNGTEYARVFDGTLGGSDVAAGGSTLITMNGSTDYLEFFVFSTSTPVTTITNNFVQFTSTWIRSN